MPIYNIEGNLLDSDCIAIAHQANCMSTMGSGIAGQIAKHPIYRMAYVADQRCNLQPQHRLGNFTYAYVRNNTQVIANLYGQLGYGRKPGVVYTKYKALANALHGLILSLMNKDIWPSRRNPEERLSLGLPCRIGCTHGGGDWDRVSGILNYFVERYDFDLYLYNFEEYSEGVDY